ncbi:acetolactate synthase [Tanacetum coccineum]|uniref:Acetolactate synthase n=1 Tax=Tanacetum coccineum TaxID=301880 RepID=A0ABQ5CC55_9ASTR
MAVITPSNPTIKPPSSTTALHRSTTTLPRFNLPITTPKRHRTLYITTNVLSKPTTVQTPQPEIYVSRYADDQPRRGSDVLVEALEREGITDVFAYPGGASMEIHQALTRSHIILLEVYSWVGGYRIGLSIDVWNGARKEPGGLGSWESSFPHLGLSRADLCGVSGRRGVYLITVNVGNCFEMCLRVGWWLVTQVVRELMLGEIRQVRKYLLDGGIGVGLVAEVLEWNYRGVVEEFVGSRYILAWDWYATKKVLQCIIVAKKVFKARRCGMITGSLQGKVVPNSNIVVERFVLVVGYHEDDVANDVFLTCVMVLVNGYDYAFWVTNAPAGFHGAMSLAAEIVLAMVPEGESVTILCSVLCTGGERETEVFSGERSWLGNKGDLEAIKSKRDVESDLYDVHEYVCSNNTVLQDKEGGDVLRALIAEFVWEWDVGTVEFVDREVKSLKRSKIVLVQFRWNSKRGPEFTWERKDQIRSKCPQLFVDSDIASSS